ncbi:hypothetical protein [Mesorhizobium captivum]|uniref:hypothetical protein n=1 Tax=Mesorhizobium captivum TaxID=3072319 RepID=UPI002A24DF41|nr:MULTISPECIES: hypothetical protein [unclassified Mesorhizobium]MDX8448033.1 hypothetical protein [Mesorhizobium sp. VK3C]MDX8502774.1 hypothetical protein [Mesorhizobium sp. VK4C]
MLPYGVADSAELAILTKALNDYCAEHRIVREDERERIAIKVMCLFKRGMIEPDQLSEELERLG